MPALPLSPALAARADHACELCRGTDLLGAFPVPPDEADALDRTVCVCSSCLAWLEGSPADPKHAFCLQEAVWSEVPAVQVVAWRLLHQLPAEAWARDLLDQVYLEDEIRAWAEAGLAGGAPGGPAVVDAHGTPLADGDTVSLIKDLDVKGAGFTAKRGTVVKGIRLGDDPEHVEGRVNGTAIYLKTCFLKKAS